jgi:hypothetical protein
MEIDRGGNAALMAPEIAAAQPGGSVVGVSLVLFKELLQEEIGSIRCNDAQPIRIQRNDTLHKNI